MTPFFQNMIQEFTSVLLLILLRDRHYLELSGHYSCEWNESMNVIGVIREPFARELRW